MKYKIKIISGGQTGIPTIALRLAYSLGFSTGGYTTNDYMTENGSNEKELMRYGLKPISINTILTKQYYLRNKTNIISSHICIIFSLFESNVISECIKLVKKYKKKAIIISDLDIEIDFIIDFIHSNLDRSCTIINFIGHKESRLSDQDKEKVTCIISEILNHFLDNR